MQDVVPAGVEKTLRHLAKWLSLRTAMPGAWVDCVLELPLAASEE